MSALKSGKTACPVPASGTWETGIIFESSMTTGRIASWIARERKSGSGGPSTFTLADIVPYLQGQLLGLVQRLRGVTCLHASAILIGDRAIAVAGFAGAGKSSTAAAFLQMGFPVLADDVVPVFEEAGKFMVQPAHPRDLAPPRHGGNAFWFAAMRCPFLLLPGKNATWT